MANYKIKLTKEYICNYCEYIYLSPGEANKCYLSDIEKEKQIKIFNEIANKVRLEAKTIKDIFVLLRKYSKEIYDIDFSINNYTLRKSGEIRPTHNSPIGKNTDWCGELNLRYNGLYFWIEGKWNSNEKQIANVNINWFPDLCKLFYGIHTGTFNGSKNSFCGEMNIWLDDFPNLVIDNNI